MLSKKVFVFGICFLCTLNERVHSWLFLRASLFESMAEQIREGENEGRDFSIHVPTDCSNQQEVNSLSSYNSLSCFVVCCFGFVCCCLATPPTKSKEDLEQSKRKSPTRPQLYAPQLYRACARGHDYRRGFKPQAAV